MATLHQHRCHVIIPAALQAKMNAFWASSIDKDGAGDQTFTVPLNATGSPKDPVTHYVACMALTDTQLKLVMQNFCSEGKTSEPSGWDAKAKQAKLDSLNQTAGAIQAGSGIVVLADDNVGAWSDYAAKLKSVALKVIEPDLKG